MRKLTCIEGISMDQLINNILEESGFRKNPYFICLKNNEFELDDFIETQIQFYWVVAFFSRPMAALAAKIPSAKLRMEIVRNVWEEHGEGDLKNVHGHTFIELLKRLGTNVDAIEGKTLSANVRIFNTCLSGCCVLDDYRIGVGVMGMIERMFCEISSWIAEGIVLNKWLKKEDLIHYNLHEDLDIKHSDDFFNVLKGSWGQSRENDYLIEQGLRMGTKLFNNLYLGLFEDRKKRK